MLAGGYVAEPAACSQQLLGTSVPQACVDVVRLPHKAPRQLTCSDITTLKRKTDRQAWRSVEEQPGTSNHSSSVIPLASNRRVGWLQTTTRKIVATFRGGNISLRCRGTPSRLNMVTRCDPTPTPISLARRTSATLMLAESRQATMLTDQSDRLEVAFDRPRENNHRHFHKLRQLSQPFASDGPLWLHPSRRSSALSSPWCLRFVS